MTNNGKIAYRNKYRYNYVLANLDRLRVLSFLKNGPQSWMETAKWLYFETVNGNKGSFSHLLDGMVEDLLVRTEYIEKDGTVLYATSFGLEKMRQVQEEIAKL